MKTLIQKIKFKASPKILFNMYMDSKKHSVATGGKAVISRKVGGSFSAHGGYIKGKNLKIVPNQMIVQTWRGGDWAAKDIDSIFILTFEKASGGSLVTMVHANVPDRHGVHLAKGWKDHYWKPWNKYLASL
ncbi:MAG TPA: SRPBCC domain-containing protein [bacterium]